MLVVRSLSMIECEEEGKVYAGVGGWPGDTMYKRACTDAAVFVESLGIYYYFYNPFLN